MLQNQAYTWFKCGGNREIQYINLVCAKMHDLHGEKFRVNLCKLGRAQWLWNRLCQIWLHHVFTSPLEALGPTVRIPAVFRLLNFEWISVLAGLATAVESARIIRTGLNWAYSFFHPGASACTEFRRLFQVWIFWCARDEPIDLCFNHRWFGLTDSYQSVFWLVLNGILVAEIRSFQFFGWCGTPKLSLHLV